MRTRRLLKGLSRPVLTLALLGLVLSAPASAGGENGGLVVRFINHWAGTGSRVVFEGNLAPKNATAVVGTEGYWLQRFGSQKLEPIGMSSPVGFCGNAYEESWEVLSLALGAKGTIGCAAVSGGILETDVAVYVALANGETRNLVGTFYGGGAEDSTPGIRPGLVPAIFGDGHFLGYLEIEPGGVVSLFRITSSGESEHVADLPGLSSCGDQSYNCADANVDSGNIVIREFGDSAVHVFTTSGRPVASFDVNAPPYSGGVAIRKQRIVVITADHRLAVYTLHGKLVHSYPVKSARFGSVSTYYGFAAYADPSGTTVYVLKLSTGQIRPIVRLPSAHSCLRVGAFTLEQAGLAVGRSGSTGFVYVPWKKIRAKFR
ncbi:MAG: hypothetical protein ABSC36_00380 [Gaiellaceae bacterium]